MPVIALPDRSVVRIRGADAQRLLHDVTTPDVAGLDTGTACPGALLTPQGKIMFDFVLAREDPDGFLVDIDAAQADAFVKRMTLYKLRAKVDIVRDEALHVGAVWDTDAPEGARRDRRFPDAFATWRVHSGHPVGDSNPDAYAARRIAAGVAESGGDYALSEAFPHDALMDLNGGVSFRKGCFVGQEVVSRMQHRGTARRRLVRIEADGPLPPTGTPLTADGKAIGALGTVDGAAALAIVRTDRAAAAIAAGKALEADGQAVTIAMPAWTGLSLKAGADADEDA